MSEPKHTPGPWVAISDPHDKWYKHRVYRGLAEGPIANVLRSAEDARLIAAAPDLLRELSHLVSLLETLEWSARDEWGNDQCPECEGERFHGHADGHADGCELVTRLVGARAAIQKAEGETE